jgi:hypothetical protein
MMYPHAGSAIHANVVMASVYARPWLKEQLMP